MAKVIPFGEPVNAAERQTVALLRDSLPAGYLILHNFDVRRDSETFEVDIAVIAPHAVYVVDVKGTRGLIDVYGPKWYPEGRQPFTSPLSKLRGHAKTIKGFITGSQPGRRDLEDIYVDVAVILTAPDASLVDQGGRDAPHVTTLKKAAAFFQNSSRIPLGKSKNITAHHNMVLKSLQGVAKPRSGPLRFGSWEVIEKLGGTDAYTEYRVFNVFVGQRAHALLRAYQADPYKPAEERTAQRRLISNAYRALNSMPGHPGIVGVRDFFATEGEDKYILVTEDVPGQALHLHIEKPALALTFDQKTRIAGDILTALTHLQTHQVVHRNLTPSNVLVGTDGRMRLAGFEFARAGADWSRTIAQEIINDLEPAYMAPEVYGEPSAASPASDVFSAGLVLYELFTGEKPFATFTEMFNQTSVFAVRPSALRPELPKGFDEWLQKLCTFDPDNRPSAATAAAELSGLLAPATELRADMFIEQVLAIQNRELRQLIDLVAAAETEWLEFKAALLPPPDRQNVNAADGQWAVTRALIALINSIGGAVLLGVDDNGNPAPLADSDPKGYLENEGWDVFARKVLDAGLFREGGWATAKKGTWRTDVATLKRHVTTIRATLDGRDMVVLLIRPREAGAPLLEARNIRGGAMEELVEIYVRRRGDVGVIDAVTPEEAIAWSAGRRLTSPIYESMLQQLSRVGQMISQQPSLPPTPLDFSNLVAGFQLTPKYFVEKRLGKPGAFGVAYKVIDTLGDVARAIKLVLHDRHSTLDRLKKEYRTLLRIPDHPNVVKVIDADFLPSDGPPFIVFEYVNGLDVGEMIEGNLFAAEDALELARQVASGLVHIHQNGVFHCDIKPRNLLWTDRGVKIIDFNVSILAAASNGYGGGSRRYIPPDLDLEAIPSQGDLVDRDVYALGLTLYEAVTGRYPWETTIPPPGKTATDPREFSNLGDLAPEFINVMLKLIAPRRAERFASAVELQSALAMISSARRAVSAVDVSSSLAVSSTAPEEPPPNSNLYVRHLLTVYSQSNRSNAGTRGLDAISEQTYVETALDRDLLPSVLAGEFALVIISGNAGDGKTAFLQKLERRAEEEGAEINRSLQNGTRFVLHGRTYLSNYDGSQDEGEQNNDEVLRAFFGPFVGGDTSSWPSRETRLIAINEGRLVDFLEANLSDFAALTSLVKQGLLTGEPAHSIAVVNLNLRSVVTATRDFDGSILERLVRRMTHEKFWEPCHNCDLKDRCYAFHNAQTFQDETARPHVIQRLNTLYTLTHLRGRLHITLRDLRSALAFMLVGTRDCDEIHELYNSGRRQEIVDSFYFNSWKGGDAPNADRLLTLLGEVDVAGGDDPRLDRALDFVSPEDDRSLFRFERRGNYDRNILRSLYNELPRDFTGHPSAHQVDAHHRFISMARRRVFFERRDNAWSSMLPYKTADQMLAVVRGEHSAEALLEPLLFAINRGEGLSRPERLGNDLALEVRRVAGGSVRSYRIYARDRFSLSLKDQASRSRFVEHMPTCIVLRYRGDAGLEAELLVTLEIFEMLQRLNDGYWPSVEEEQGHYLSLAVFKNLLGSAPYQEVLLTSSGHDFYRVARHADGRLEMSRVRKGGN